MPTRQQNARIIIDTLAHVQHILTVTDSTITVQWGSVTCMDQDGAITGYTVQYGVMGSKWSWTQSN